MVHDEYSEEYVVEAKSVNLPPDTRTEDLLERRDELVAHVLEYVPVEARAEVGSLLEPGAVDMIHTVPWKEVADLVAEIYALDRELATRNRR